MTQNRNQNILYTRTLVTYMDMMSKFPRTDDLLWIDPKEFDMNNYIKNSFKGCALEVDLEHPKELFS